ncbi:hypothetical protein A2160_03080 [Candidatus Beckwithbacteria bacterium RBG_13_42_9]|uniref:dTDP-4-dehydrorhamnose 3,5-epimerase n=1 Tax=Candidatus Beckwithbacteria bacterium RBG_13_42_9 TaxID=1797457 RepID=A0A1F5E7S1_9BACT|nr:MAG: hypothetical protein A2160_03080 [Candidatus Beckwithbacteria bacterium RBG_13_42_9]
MNITDRDFFILDKLKSYPLIKGVVVHPLKVNRDPRGFLVEALRVDWADIYDKETRPFRQMYYSQTDSGVARDEDRWHFHPGGQEDRFAVINGDIVVAVYDNRQDSSTYQTLNLFKMGEGQGDNGQYLLLVPPQTLHGFVVVSKNPALLVNYPTKIYDANEEKRVPFSEVKFKDGSNFNWDLIRREFK